MNGAIGWVKRLESFQIWEGSFETNANPEEALVHAPLPSLETGVEFEGKTRSNYCRKTLEGSRALSGGSERAQLQICGAKGIRQSLISRSSGGSRPRCPSVIWKAGQGSVPGIRRKE